MNFRPAFLSISAILLVSAASMNFESAAAGPTGVAEVDDVFWCIDQLTYLIFQALGLHGLKCQIMNAVRQPPVHGQLESCSTAMVACVSMDQSPSNQGCSPSGSNWRCTWRAYTVNRGNSVFDVPGFLTTRATAYCDGSQCNEAQATNGAGDCQWLAMYSCTTSGTHTFRVDLSAGECLDVTGGWFAYASQSPQYVTGWLDGVSTMVGMAYTYHACHGQPGGFTALWRYA